MGKYYFTVGPSQLYPSVKNHLQKALANNILSISHRSIQFEEILLNTVSTLKNLFNIPPEHKIFFLSSATEAMERIIQNCVEKKSFHFINGAFSHRFYLIAKQLKKEAYKYQVDYGESFDFNSVHIDNKIELICITHNETSTGVTVDLKDIYAIKKRYPQALVAVDIVSSVPYAPVDYSNLDCVFFSVQKGMGLPAGLGVLIISPGAFAKAKFLAKKLSIGSYHSFLSLNKYAEKNQTPETPNVLALYLLGKIASDMKRYGIARIRKEIDKKAEAFYEFFDKKDTFSPFVKKQKIRSQTTIVVETKREVGQMLKKLAARDFILSNGYGKFRNQQIRIANFPAHSLLMVKKLLKTLDQIESTTSHS